MNKDKKTEHRREMRLRAKQRKLLKANELEEELDSDELDVIETASEPAEKEMDPEEVSIAPTSFNELDEAKVAAEEAEDIMEVTLDTEMLVRNILRDSEMDPTKKVEAIHSVAKEFGNRLKAGVRSIVKSIGIDLGPDKKHNSILIQKDASNNWRWVGCVSNNYVDWDGDIISEDAHKEYLEWLDKNMDVSPVFVSWHTPGTARMAPVDFAMYENGFLIMSGPLQENEAMGLLKAQSKIDLGMSHGTFALSRDSSDPRVITKYRMYEASDLPLVKAANPFTDFETIVKEVGMNKKEYLTQIMGSEEKADAFLEKIGLKQKILDEAGIESKEKSEVAVVPEVVPEVVSVPVVVTVSEPVVPTATVPTMDEILKAMDIDGLNAFIAQAKEDHEKIPVLEALVKELQGSQDEKLAEKLTPPVGRFTWSLENRPSLSEENVVDGEEKKKNQPGVPDGYWLSEATQTTPVPVQ